MLNIVGKRYWYFALSLLVIIPGLIANWMERQGVLKTVTTLLMGGAMVRLMVIVVLGGRAFEHL